MLHPRGIGLEHPRINDKRSRVLACVQGMGIGQEKEVETVLRCKTACSSKFIRR